MPLRRKKENATSDLLSPIAFSRLIKPTPQRTSLIGELWDVFGSRKSPQEVNPNNNRRKNINTATKGALIFELSNAQLNPIEIFYERYTQVERAKSTLESRSSEMMDIQLCHSLQNDRRWRHEKTPNQMQTANRNGRPLKDIRMFSPSSVLNRFFGGN